MGIGTICTQWGLWVMQTSRCFRKDIFLLNFLDGIFFMLWTLTFIVLGWQRKSQKTDISKLKLKQSAEFQDLNYNSSSIPINTLLTFTSSFIHVFCTRIETKPIPFCCLHRTKNYLDGLRKITLKVFINPHQQTQQQKPETPPLHWNPAVLAPHADTLHIQQTICKSCPYAPDCRLPEAPSTLTSHW